MGRQQGTISGETAIMRQDSKAEQAQTSPSRFFCGRLLTAGLCVIGLSVMVCRGDVILPPAAVVLSVGDETSPEAVEYRVKAAFIYNFTKFVVWPSPQALESSSEQNGQSKSSEKPLYIGILGKNPFGNAFVPVLNKEAANRPVQLVEIESFAAFQRSYRHRAEAVESYKKAYGETLAKCEILFLCDSEKSFLPELLALAGGRAVLTVSDVPNFAADGGMIGFVKENNKIRFEVNVKAAQKEGIKVGSQLLGLARQVYK